MGAAMNDVDLLAKLVAFDTTSANPAREIGAFLGDYLESQGYDVRFYRYADGDKFNLVARIGPDAPDGVILSGHVDVVPAREADWESDPFTLTDRGDRYVARGSADMKGFVALAMNAVARLGRDSLTRPVVLLFTCDEELGTVGAQQFVRDWDSAFELPMEAVIGEPTELRVVRMHKGHLKARYTFLGRAAHSGYPHLGVSAIEPAGDLLVRLRELRRKWELLRAPTSVHFPECPYPALNVGVIRGGAAVNIVPAECVIDVGARVLPAQNSAAFAEELREIAGEAMFEVINDSPPMLCDEDAPIYEQTSALADQVETLGASYATDAGPLQQLGVSCVLWGPGNIVHAHRANELLFKEQFQRGGELLDAFLRRRCVEGQ